MPYVENNTAAQQRPDIVRYISSTISRQVGPITTPMSKLPLAKFEMLTMVQPYKSDVCPIFKEFSGPTMAQYKKTPENKEKDFAEKV